MSELLPCPFCGGDDMAVSVDGGVSPGYVDVYQKYVCTCTISCERCHAEIHGYAASNITCDLYDRSVNEAAAAWNTRHVETNALREACMELVAYAGTCPFDAKDADTASWSERCERECSTDIDMAKCWERYFLECGRKVEG